MTFTSSPKLVPIFDFFEKTGSERLNGLDPSYFLALNDVEKEEAWEFLSNRFSLSTERISALYHLDTERAVAAFKKVIEEPMPGSAYPAQRESREECRLLMLRYINNIDPSEKYISAMTEFAHSEFEDVRSLFAQSVPINKVTREAVEALKGMIFTETERIPLASAIAKFMVIHGMDFDRNDSSYKSIYKALRSDDPEEKRAAMRRLEEARSPNYM